MKKMLLIAVAGLLAISAFAQMDSFDRSYTLVTTVETGTASQVLRGEIEAIYVSTAAGKTNAVTISDGLGTIFSNARTTTGLYPIRVPLYTTAGAAITDNHLFISSAGVTGTYSIVRYGARPVAGPVTITTFGAADTVGTNAVNIRVIWKKQ
jgi:hypothetical protein